MKNLIALGIVAAFFAVTTSSFAVGLSESDFDYLEKQDVERTSNLVRDLSPREQARLHAIINDNSTANNPIGQAKNVAEALAAFREHQLWERTHPGQLWDLPKR